MLVFRRFLVLTLVVSLLASDAISFWHIGDCGCNHETDKAALALHPADHRGCSHQDNPFAKRRVAAEKSATATIDRVQSDQPDQPQSPSCPPDHDSDDCSICRWLTLAKDGQGFHVVAVCLDLSCFPANTVADRSQPSHEPRFQELSRRGPPAQPFFT